MKIKKLNLTLNYPISWQKDKVLRDYIQNFYDATEMDKFKQEFHYTFNNSTLTMEMKEVFDKEWLYYMGASTKQENCQNNRYAGQFGEGFKVASLVAYRDFHWNIEMASKNWVLHVTSVESVIDGQKVDFLAYEQTGRLYQVNSILTIKGVGEEDYHTFQKVLNDFEYEGNPQFGACIMKNDELAVYHTNPDVVEAGKGYAFVRYQKRAVLDFPLIICSHHYSAADEDDRDRNYYTKQQVQNLLYHEFCISKELFPAQAAYEILLSVQRFWNNGLKNYIWKRLMIRLFYAICEEEKWKQIFLEEFENKLVAENGRYINRNRDRISREWLKNSQYRTRRRVIFDFTLLGISSIEQLCEENNGFQVYREPDETQRECIAILSKAAGQLMGDVLCYDAFPKCGIVVNDKAPMEGLAHISKTKQKIALKDKRFVPVNEVRHIYLQQYVFHKDEFGRALAVYMHELLHQFGGDSHMQFHHAIVLMNRRMMERVQIIQECEEKWREVFC